MHEHEPRAASTAGFNVVRDYLKGEGDCVKYLRGANRIRGPHTRKLKCDQDCDNAGKGDVQVPCTK